MSVQFVVRNQQRAHPASGPLITAASPAARHGLMNRMISRSYRRWQDEERVSGVSEPREERVDTIEGEIRGVTVRWDQVLVAGHVVEITCPTGVAEAEQVYGKRWDDELDRHF